MTTHPIVPSVTVTDAYWRKLKDALKRWFCQEVLFHPKEPLQQSFRGNFTFCQWNERISLFWRSSVVGKMLFSFCSQLENSERKFKFNSATTFKYKFIRRLNISTEAIFSAGVCLKGLLPVSELKHFPLYHTREGCQWSFSIPECPQRLLFS